jgi:small ligand-binding sensory domain FIST
MEIDGLPALDVLKQEVGEILSRNLDKTAGFIFAGLPVKDSDLGDYLVRPLIGFDVNRGWLAIGATVASGDSILFARRDRASAVADLNRILGRLKQRINRPVRGGIYVSCIARGPNLFGTETEETALILQQIGDFPLTGFFANGEISRGQIYAHTGVLTLFL